MAFTAILQTLKQWLSAGQHHWQTQWQQKQLPVSQVAEKIPNGSEVYIGSTAATAYATIKAVVENEHALKDIHILHFIPGGELPHLDADKDNIRTTAFFPVGKTAQKVEEGLADYTPISSAKMHRLIDEKRIPIDVAIVMVTPPNAEGYCSLGIGVDLSLEAIKNARVVIAEVNKHMPWTCGRSQIHQSQIHWWTENHNPLPQADDLFPGYSKWQLPGNILDKIAENVMFEIPDGATLKFDMTVLTNNLVPYLSQRKNLGLHTDVLNDQLVKLHQTGVINNSQKNINRGKTMVAHAFGSQQTYDYIHNNPDIEFHPAHKINRIDKIARLHNLICIISGLKVDLSGQVAIDSVGKRFYAGVGSVDDTIRGAGYSRNGKPIVVLPSVTRKGNSNIVFDLPQGTGVTITRLDVHYVITEYGTAFLLGKSIRERCLALIAIAHPQHREQLLEQAKNSFLIHAQQPGHSFLNHYPKQWESLLSTRDAKQVLVRPIKAVDEDKLRAFFHQLSDQNVYMRYFARVQSLPQKVLKQYADIDYSSDMALVAVYPPETAQHEIIGLAQWSSNPDDPIPEIAFQVRDDWLGEGIGVYLFRQLIDIARQHGLKKIKAEVLADNKAMNMIFENSRLPYDKSSEFGVSTYTFKLCP